MVVMLYGTESGMGEVGGVYLSVQGSVCYIVDHQCVASNDEAV